jgi:hypothetical protein
MQAITRKIGSDTPPPEPDPLVLTMLNLPIDEYNEVLEETEGKFTLLEIATCDF